MRKTSWEKFINDMRYAEKIILAGLVSNEVLEDVDYKKAVRLADSVDVSRVRELKDVRATKIVFKTHRSVSNLDRKGKVYVECVYGVRFYIIKTEDMNIIYYVK